MAKVESGRIWDGYVVDSTLSEGPETLVLLVSHVTRKTWHAVKVLRNVDSRKRMRVEQEAIFRDELRHPNIVPATEAIDVDGRPGLVMDFVEGPTYAEWLREGAPDDLWARLAVFAGIVEGCRFAHHHGVVHRDLRPGNVLLQPSPTGQWIPRIADFGLAKALSPERGKFGGLTTVNTGLGSAGYAAPEQVRDASGVDHRADLYALGCILYETMCGIGPFAGQSTFETLQAQKEGRFAAPEDLSPEAPPGLHALVRQLLAPQPEDRPASCDQILDVLEALRSAVPKQVVSDATSEGAPHRPSEALLPGIGWLLLATALPAGAMAFGALVVFAI